MICKENRILNFTKPENAEENSNAFEKPNGIFPLQYFDHLFFKQASRSTRGLQNRNENYLKHRKNYTYKKIIKKLKLFHLENILLRGQNNLSQRRSQSRLPTKARSHMFTENSLFLHSEMQLEISKQGSHAKALTRCKNS